MAKFRTRCVVPGVHHSPDGKIVISRERIRRWAEKFRAMRAAGHSIPVAWGHQPDAEPEDEATYQHRVNRYNAGYLDSVEVGDDGALWITADCPGVEVDEAGNLVHWARMPDGREVKCAIKETSAAINSWTDGQRKKWSDIITHCALTVYPVIPNAQGFSKLSTVSSSRTTSRPIYLSTLTTRVKPMTATATACRPESCTLFEPNTFEADLADDEEGDSGISLSTLNSTSSSHKLARVMRARVWRRSVKERLQDFVRRGLNVNEASAFWMGTVNGETGIRRLSTLGSGEELRERVEKQLLEWQLQFSHRHPDHMLPPTREQRESIKLLTTRGK